MFQNKKKNWRTRRAPKLDENGEPIKREIEPAKARKLTMQRAVKLLAAKPRSIGELRAKLLEKDWTNEETVSEVLAKLEDYKFLDDAQYAELYASFNVRQKPQGKRLLQQKLALKKIDKETAQNALEKVFEETPEDELLERALEKRLRSKGVPSTREDFKKLYDYLLRQGFSYDLISSRLRRIKQEDFEVE